MRGGAWAPRTRTGASLPTGSPPMNAAPLLQIDDQVAGRFAGFHVRGLQLVISLVDDASNTRKTAQTLGNPQGGRHVERGERRRMR